MWTAYSDLIHVRANHVPATETLTAILVSYLELGLLFTTISNRVTRKTTVILI